MEKMRFQPGRKMRTAPATCSVSMYFSRASTSSKDVSFSLICAMERLVSAEYSGPQMTLQLVCGDEGGGGGQNEGGWGEGGVAVSAAADTHVILCALLVLVLLLAVHGRRDEAGHLDAVLQEVLWKRTGKVGGE